MEAILGSFYSIASISKMAAATLENGRERHQLLRFFNSACIFLRFKLHRNRVAFARFIALQCFFSSTIT
jgi:hypothetical protein